MYQQYEQSLLTGQRRLGPTSKDLHAAALVTKGQVHGADRFNRVEPSGAKCDPDGIRHNMCPSLQSVVRIIRTTGIHAGAGTVAGYSWHATRLDA